MSVTPLQALPIEQLRQRSSTKWRKYPPDVLPLFVAETDFAPAPAITRALARAVELGDTGYTPPDPGIAHAYADFALRRFGWSVDPSHVRTTCDVMMGVVEILRRVTSPGDRVVVTPPVYPPFFECVPEAGAVVRARSAGRRRRRLGAGPDRHRGGARGRRTCRAAVQSSQSDRDGALPADPGRARRARRALRRGRHQRRDPRAAHPRGSAVHAVPRACRRRRPGWGTPSPAPARRSIWPA